MLGIARPGEVVFCCGTEVDVDVVSTVKSCWSRDVCSVILVNRAVRGGRDVDTAPGVVGGIAMVVEAR